MIARALTRWLAAPVLLGLALAIPRAWTEDATPTPEVDFQAGLTATEIAQIEAVEHNVLHRPIELSDENRHWVDRTYGYGSTDFDTRPAHLGVEFVNERGTPVYAAKGGRVVFAGDDRWVMLGPQLDYYGKVVALAHDLYSLAGERLFTLYAHLDKIHVQAGDAVDDQARLGRVGSSGVALGPHLHFEVRVSDPFDYRQTRNPELWLQHYVDHGMIVGSLRDEAGEPLTGKRLTVRSPVTSRDVYTYSGEVNSDPVWRENFVVGDLPAGDYEILVLNERGSLTHREWAIVEAYRTTVVEIALEE